MPRVLVSYVYFLLVIFVAGCGDDAGVPTPDASTVDAATNDDGLTLRSEVTAVTRPEDVRGAVFIPPFEVCRDPIDGDEPGQGPGGQVCTNVAISGCTEEGKRFIDYADCDIVRTQRPFSPKPPAGESAPNDPRLEDEDYLAELAWVTEQVEAAGCVCCHDSENADGKAGIWDIRLGPLWLDSLSDSGLALFVGLADSSVLGAYPKEENNGFDRMLTGLPTTDTERMQAFLREEMDRRGLTEEEALATPPFGGPIYANSVAVPKPCENGEGVAEDGTVHWIGGPARYVYVLAADSKNPGVPPNLDLPEGTLWRLDVLASELAVASGLEYGTTPDGSFQVVPESGRAPELEDGETYHIVVLIDVGLPAASCLFTFGEPLSSGPGDAGFADPAACEGDATFGTACTESSTCTCDAASFCAVQPGVPEGFCSATGCSADPSVCPEGWSCFDLSMFVDGGTSFCLQP
jgi:hypothetical protein